MRRTSRLCVVGALLLALISAAVSASAEPPARSAATPKLYLKVAGYRAGVDLFPPGTLVNDCSAYCAFAFPLGTQVTLRARWPLGSSFVGWMQAFNNFPAACTGNFQICRINLDSSKAVKAAFSPVSLSWYELNGTGVVDFLDTRPLCGSECRLYRYDEIAHVHAHADAGYVFSSWYGGCGADEFCTVRMNADGAISPSFRCVDDVCHLGQPIDHPTTVKVQVSGPGRVTGPHINCPAVNCTYQFKDNSLVSLVASGAPFKGWALSGVRCSTRNSRCTFKASHTATVSPRLIAYFGY